MSAKHGSRARIWVAQFEISGYGNSLEAHMKRDAVDVTPQGQTGNAPAKVFIPGLLEWNKNAKGFWDDAVGALDDILAPLVQTQTQIIFAPAGGSEGQIAKAGYNAIVNDYNIGSPVNGANSFDAAFQGNNLLARTKIIRNATLTGAGNGSAFDVGAAGTQGVEAFLVVTAFTGTSAVIKVQSSADGATGWADRVTFTTVTAATFERATGGTNVDRYQRVAVTGTFSSMTFLVVSHNIGVYLYAAG